MYIYIFEKYCFLVFSFSVDVLFRMLCWFKVLVFAMFFMFVHRFGLYGFVQCLLVVSEVFLFLWFLFFFMIASFFCGVDRVVPRYVMFVLYFVWDLFVFHDCFMFVSCDVEMWCRVALVDARLLQFQIKSVCGIVFLVHVVRFFFFLMRMSSCFVFGVVFSWVASSHFVSLVVIRGLVLHLVCVFFWRWLSPVILSEMFSFFVFVNCISWFFLRCVLSLVVFWFDCDSVRDFSLVHRGCAACWWCWICDLTCELCVAHCQP